jgi:hypothetical protein
MGTAFFAALCLAIAVLARSQLDEEGVSNALAMTGRLSFLFFWPAYVGSAIATLFGSRFAVLSRYGREFSSGQLVHFALVVWVIRISHLPLIKGVMPFFAIGVVWTCVLALSSFDRVRDIFGTNLWRILRSAGVEYIALVFFEDFVLTPDSERRRAFG